MSFDRLAGLAILLAIAALLLLATVQAALPPAPRGISWAKVTTDAQGRPLKQPVSWYELEQSRDGFTWNVIARTRVLSRPISPPWGTCYRVRAVVPGPRYSDPSKALCYGLVPPRNLTFTVGKP